MLHPAKSRLAHPPERVAEDVRRELARMGKPLGAFDPSRYFRATDGVKFHGVPTGTVRQTAATIDRLYGSEWGIGGAMRFADALIASDYLDEKGVGIELLARHRREFTPGLLGPWKKWLKDGHASNWATTDSICGSLIGPLVVGEPRLARKVAAWSTDRSLWVRRASAVGLIPCARKGMQLDLAYRVARSLHGDDHDLIQKAVGWLLREAGKADLARLERYLRDNGPNIPRTTVRYAIERFSEPKRRRLLAATR